jgi:hypothetical protein
VVVADAGAAPPLVVDRDAITSAGASIITPFLLLIVKVFGLSSE